MRSESDRATKTYSLPDLCDWPEMPLGSAGHQPEQGPLGTLTIFARHEWHAGSPGRWSGAQAGPPTRMRSQPDEPGNPAHGIAPEPAGRRRAGPSAPTGVGASCRGGGGGGAVPEVVGASGKPGVGAGTRQVDRRPAHGASHFTHPASCAVRHAWRAHAGIFRTRDGSRVITISHAPVARKPSIPMRMPHFNGMSRSAT